MCTACNYKDVPLFPEDKVSGLPLELHTGALPALREGGAPAQNPIGRSPHLTRWGLSQFLRTSGTDPKIIPGGGAGGIISPGHADARRGEMIPRHLCSIFLPQILKKSRDNIAGFLFSSFAVNCFSGRKKQDVGSRYQVSGIRYQVPGARDRRLDPAELTSLFTLQTLHF